VPAHRSDGVRNSGYGEVSPPWVRGLTERSTG